MQDLRQNNLSGYSPTEDSTLGEEERMWVCVGGERKEGGYPGPLLHHYLGK